MSAPKDNFTTDEAAAYFCMCRAQFYKLRARIGLNPFELEGKKLYRYADLRKIAEDAAQKTYGNPIHSAGKAR